MSQPNSASAPQLITAEGQVIANDWQLVADEDAIGAEGSSVLGFKRALAELPTLNGRYGVRVEPGDDVRELIPYFDKIALIEVSFPTYRDGRGYSSARLLKQVLGYTGPIRAVGDVLRDQAHYMLRCGFSELLLKDADPEGVIAWIKSLYEFSYQSAADAHKPVWALRHAKTEV
ncbi:MAG: DUF934 domain-containing protein [Asticcacaulis sp.]